MGVWFFVAERSRGRLRDESCRCGSPSRKRNDEHDSDFSLLALGQARLAWNVQMRVSAPGARPA
jgi:hypothetical protein